MGDLYLWLNPGLRDNNYIKGILADILQNIFRRRYGKNINSPENKKKCEIFNKCNNVSNNNIMIDVYAKKRYLTELNPQISEVYSQN